MNRSQLSKTPDHIYYNVIMGNSHFSAGSNTNNLATFSETRVEAIVDKPEDYYLSIIRFNVPGSSIPLFVCPIQLGLTQYDPDLTIFSVNLMYGSYSSQTYLTYQSNLYESNLPPGVGNPPYPKPLPPSQNNGVQVDSPYYYVYTYETMIDMINQAIVKAFSKLKAATSGSPPADPPYFVYNAETQLLQFICQDSYVGYLKSTTATPSLINTIGIYFNDPLKRFIDGFRFNTYSIDSPLGLDIQMDVVNYNNNFTQVKPVYSIGTASQTGTTVTGLGTTFTVGMVGGTIKWNYLSSPYLNSQAAIITAFTNGTTITVDRSQSVQTGSGATATLTVDFLGRVTSFIITAPGINYYVGEQVAFVSGSNITSTINVLTVDGGGGILTATLLNQGFGYAPGAVTIAGDVLGYYSIVYGATNEHLLLEQEYNTLAYWNSFRNLVFVTGSIPVASEYVPTSVFGPNSGSGINNSRQILTDFEPLLQYAGDSRTNLQYYPQGPYRLVNLETNIPLRRFDVQIFWQDNNNVLRPVYLSRGTEATIKFLFLKKTSNLGY